MSLLKQQTNKEVRQVRILSDRMLEVTNEILERYFQRSIFRIKPQDKQRLLTLRLWSQKYKVPLDYILQAVVPVFLATISTKSKNKGALGFRIPTLVGSKAECILQDQITKDFPENEHLSIWKWDQIQSIVKQRTEDEFTQKGNEKGITEYKTVKAYVSDYGKKVRGKQERFDKENSKKANRRRPYRGNPWLG